MSVMLLAEKKGVITWADLSEIPEIPRYNRGNYLTRAKDMGLLALVPSDGRSRRFKVVKGWRSNVSLLKRPVKAEKWSPTHIGAVNSVFALGGVK